MTNPGSLGFIGGAVHTVSGATCNAAPQRTDIHRLKAERLGEAGNRPLRRRVIAAAEHVGPQVAKRAISSPAEVLCPKQELSVELREAKSTAKSIVAWQAN